MKRNRYHMMWRKHISTKVDPLQHLKYFDPDYESPNLKNEKTQTEAHTAQKKLPLGE